jgi:hypothetical protein
MNHSPNMQHPYESDLPSDPRYPHQVIRPARLIATKGDGEAMVFNLEFLKVRLTFIVNLPFEGEDTAPVYVRIGLVGSEERNGWGPRVGYSRQRPPRPRNDEPAYETRDADQAD